jgi:hypothetical protein
MWQGQPPRTLRGARRGDQSDPRRRSPGAANPDNPYRPYGESTGTRLPAPYAGGVPGTYGRLPTAGAGWEQVEEGPHHRHFGIAVFHDGNPGHLWRGTLFSLFGEATLAVGVIIWLATLGVAPLELAAAVAALGLPHLLMGPLAAPLENEEEPGTPLKWIGRLRVVLALGLIPMHFHTILPVVYALLFAISLCGRLHDALRTAATRTCLAPGELEHVANDMHIGSAIAAVVGPLLASVFFILVGERILLVSIGVAAFFLLSMNSESFLDALPPARREFLLVTPENAYGRDEWPETLPPEEEAEDDPERRRERQLPVWYQQGPETSDQAMADLRVGLGLAGAFNASSAAFWALATLSLIGGGLAVLEVFFLGEKLLLPPFYLGPLLAAEGAGLALGVVFAGTATGGSGWRGPMLTGLGGSGVALVLLAAAPNVVVALAAALLLGVMNALAVQGARRGLFTGFDHVEQRALATAEGATSALAGLIGALLFAIFAAPVSGLPLPLHLHLATWPVTELVLCMGLALVVAAVVFGILASRAPRVAEDGNATTGKRTRWGRSAGSTDADDDAEPEGTATGLHDTWDDDDAGGWTGAYADASDDYADEDELPDEDDDDGYDAPPPPRRRPRW